MIEFQNVTIQCPQCGHDVFEYPENLKDDDFVKCKNCHFDIAYADLREAGFEQAKELAIPKLKAEFESMSKNLFRS